MSNTQNATTTPPESHDHTDVGEAVVTAIAEAEGISPLDVSPQLATVVDPDALNNLIGRMDDIPGGRPGRIEFAYGDHLVTVTADGAVSVADAETPD